MDVKGRSIKLDEVREVFVGHVDGRDETFIAFVNSEGVKTRLRISMEATEALTQLLNTSDHVVVWQAV